MSDMEFYDNGFKEFDKMMKSLEISEIKAIEAIETGVKQFVEDVRKLPKPRSEITKPGYTHLLDTVTYKKKKDEIEVGWGEYYGPMQENGTKKMSGTPHIRPTFQQNKDRYYKTIMTQLFG